MCKWAEVQTYRSFDLAFIFIYIHTAILWFFVHFIFQFAVQVPKSSHVSPFWMAEGDQHI